MRLTVAVLGRRAGQTQRAPLADGAQLRANAIVAMPQLLAQLALTGMVGLGDAMQAQRALSIQLVAAGGASLWFVQDNRPTLLAAVEQGHGRREARTRTVSRMLREYVDWPYLDQGFRRARVVRKHGTRSVEVRYGSTSMPSTVAAARRILEVARAAWGIENGLQHRRAVPLAEDACQVRRGNAPHVRAALNTTVIGIVSQTGERKLPTAQRSVAYAYDRMLAQLTASACEA